MSAAARAHRGSDDVGRGDRATGVEERDLVAGRQIERRPTLERAGHALALVIHYVRDTADGDALVFLYRDIAVDDHTRGPGFDLRVLRIQDPEAKARQVHRLGTVVMDGEELDSAAFVGRLDLL